MEKNNERSSAGIRETSSSRRNLERQPKSGSVPPVQPGSVPVQGGEIPPSTRTIQPNEENWKDFAFCLQNDPERFFVTDKKGIEETKKLCARCAVTSFCLDYALRNNHNGKEDGIWGGLTPEERRKLQRFGRR